MDEPTKAGNRNNAEDRARIRTIRKMAGEIANVTREMEPDDEDKTDLPILGGELVKADITIDLPAGMLEWVTVKAGANEWELDVLGVPFGGPYDGKDRDRQYFDGRTNIYQEHYKTIPAVYGHGMNPEGKRGAKPEIIGTAEYSHKDGQGHWYKVVLNKASKLAQRIWEAAKKGLARASSGSLSGMVRFDADGHISDWPVAEMTLVDLETSKLIPANPYAIAMPAMKAAYEAAGIELPSVNQPEATAGGDVPGAADKTTKTTLGVIEMDEKDLLELLDKRDAEKSAAAAKAQEAAAIEALRKENEAMKAQLAEANRLPGGAPVMRKWADVDKYDSLNAAETGLLIDTLKAAGREVSPAAYKAVALKVARSNDDYAKAGLKEHFGELSDGVIKAMVEKAATDPAYSTLSGYGSQFVGTAYSNQLWEAIRADARVVGRIPTVVIPDGYSSEYFPIEGADPTWYKVAETTANDSTMKIPAGTVTHSLMATANKQITVAKMGARTSFTGELQEDSLIPWLPNLRRQLEVSGREMMEYVVIDGDTATSSNINDIGGTTYSGAATSLFLLTNGFRKSPLVTTTTQSLSAAGGFVAENYLNTLKLLGSNGLGASNPQQCAFIVDPNTWYASAGLPEAKDRNQNIFVVDNGFVTRAYGIEVIPSWFMHYNSSTRKANTAGKVDQDTVANNAYGAIVAVRFDQWKIAYKRRMTMEVVRRPESDTWDVVALTRWGLGQRDTVAAAETYYVGV